MIPQAAPTHPLIGAGSTSSFAHRFYHDFSFFFWIFAFFSFNEWICDFDSSCASHLPLCTFVWGAGLQRGAGPRLCLLLCVVWRPPPPPRPTSRGGKRSTFPLPVGAGNLVPASSAQVVRGVLGMLWPRVSLADPPASFPGEEGNLLCLSPTSSPSSGLLCAGEGDVGRTTLGSECHSPPHWPHTLATRPLPLHSLPETHPAPSPAAPRPPPAGSVSRPPCPPCCCPSLSLGLSPSLPTCLPVCLVLGFSSPSTSLCSAVSPSFPDMSPPLAGQQPSRWLTPALRPPKSSPPLARGNPSIVEGWAWKGSPGPGFGLTQGLARLQVITAAATAPMVWSP